MGQPCPTCDGTARQRYETTVKLSVPPGTFHGDLITVPSEGNAGFKGFPAGDLLVRVVEDRIGATEKPLLSETRGETH